jgi:hypothetical protein
MLPKVNATSVADDSMVNVKYEHVRWRQFALEYGSGPSLGRKLSMFEVFDAIDDNKTSN